MIKEKTKLRKLIQANNSYNNIIIRGDGSWFTYPKEKENTLPGSQVVGYLYKGNIPSTGCLKFFVSAAGQTFRHFCFSQNDLIMAFFNEVEAGTFSEKRKIEEANKKEYRVIIEEVVIKTIEYKIKLNNVNEIDLNNNNFNLMKAEKNIIEHKTNKKIISYKGA